MQTNHVLTITQIQDVIARLETSLTAFRALETATQAFTVESQPPALRAQRNHEWTRRPRMSTTRHDTNGLILKACKAGRLPQTFTIGHVRKALIGNRITYPAVSNALKVMTDAGKLVRVSFGKYRVK